MGSSSKSWQLVNFGENVKKKEASSTVDGNINWYSHDVEQNEHFSEPKKELLYDPATPPHLSIYLEKTVIQEDTCTWMFMATLLAIAKTWKQPKCPLTEKWINKMWYICTMEYYLAVKMNEIMPFEERWMNLAISY